MRRALFGVAAAGASLFLNPPLHAQDAPRDLSDMVGARAGQAEGELGRRGYRWISTQTGDDRKWGYWWNDRTRTCVSIATVEGRYDAITTSPAPDCRQPASSAGWTPPPPQPRPLPSYPDRPPLPPPGTGGQQPDNGRLALICWGEGEKPGIQSRSAWEWNERRKRYEPRNYVESSSDPFSSTIQLELWGDGGRIRLAGKLIAPISSGGRDGWWDLSDVRMSPDRITARYRMNGLNKPKIDVDRRTGRIAIDGIEHFRGTCERGAYGDGGNRF